MTFSHKIDNTGRSKGGLNLSKRQKIVGQFVSHRVDMIRSPAWWAMNFAARRVLDRLEIEHCNHGGAENGRLACTYDDFHRVGIRRQSIPAAIVQLARLGFVEVTEKGRQAHADLRIPSRYRLTFLPTPDGAGPTDEWAKLDTEEKVNAALASIKGELNHRKRRSRKKKNTGCVNGQILGAKTHLNMGASGCENAPTGLGTKTHPLSISPRDTPSNLPTDDSPRSEARPHGAVASERAGGAG